MFLRNSRENLSSPQDNSPQVKLEKISAQLKKLLSDYSMLGRYKVVQIRQIAQSNQAMLKEIMKQLDEADLKSPPFSGAMAVLSVLCEFDNHCINACKANSVTVNATVLLTHWYLNRVGHIINDKDRLNQVIELLPVSQRDHLIQQINESTDRSASMTRLLK